MAQYNFEGEIENITEPQLEFINSVIEKHGFKDSKVTIEPVGIAGDNYAATVKRIIIEGENGTLSMIAKIAPSNEIVRAHLNAVIMFGNEHLMYTEVLPKMLELQKQAEIPEDEQFKFPICYGSTVEAPNEVILLEDLKTSGFVMLDRFTSLSNEQVTSVLKNLAIWHSLSYALKNKEPETYNYFKDNLQDMWGAIDDGSGLATAHFEQMEQTSLELLDDPNHKNIMRHKVGDVITRAAKMTKLEDGNRYAVIQHGDSWTNNIMFKFEDDIVKQSMLIDYQISKNFSPANDLLYMIFNCTDHEIRTKYFYSWVDYYHSELEKSLSNFGLKTNYVYPRDQLEADMIRYGKLAFGCSVVLASVLTLKPEEARKMKETFEKSDLHESLDTLRVLHEDTTALFKKRLIGLIESFTTFGLL